MGAGLKRGNFHNIFIGRERLGVRLKGKRVRGRVKGRVKLRKKEDGDENVCQDGDVQVIIKRRCSQMVELINEGKNKLNAK